MLPPLASSIRNLKPAPGTASGAALVAVGHPLDTLKVKLQVLAAKHSILKFVVELSGNDPAVSLFDSLSGWPGDVSD